MSIRGYLAMRLPSYLLLPLNLTPGYGILVTTPGSHGPTSVAVLELCRPS